MLADYFRLHRSEETMKPKLTDKSMRYAIRQLEKGKDTRTVAQEIGVTQRHVQRLWMEYRDGGRMHLQGQPGRPAKPLSPDEVKAVLDAHALDPAGVLRTAKNLGNHISHRRICRIMKSNGLIVSSPAKSRKRKWVRYERLYSNSMWHTDWHAMKDLRMKDLNLITYLDDASRCVTGAALFEEATSENAVVALRHATARFGMPATILSDNGSCFVGRGGRKKPTSAWTPTLFENELLNLGIELINSRPYHPQTNGKLERFHRSLEEEIWHYDGIGDYVEFYNERRLHFSLDMDNYETPLMAFHNRRATEETRTQNPNWMEADINE